jgi:ABC-2 type transport system permease protein
MRFSMKRATIIARREYLTSVRKKAFLVALIGMPAYIALVMWMSVKPQIDESVKALRQIRSLGVVDSTGVFRDAPGEVKTSIQPDVNPFETRGVPPRVQSFQAVIRRFPDQESAQRALRDGSVDQVLVIPPGYLASGELRRFVRSSSGFSSIAERPLQGWLVRGLLSGQADSLRIERVVRPSRGMVSYELTKEGTFALKDDKRELLSLFVPMLFAALMSISIVTGGQYLLQGVSEEKESRILESLICTVSAEDLLVGKLLGLGSVGLTLVAAWAGLGAAVASPALVTAGMAVPPALVVLFVVYFLLGYLFYASLMTAIGAMTNNMREAQTVAWAFTFANFVPFIALWVIVSNPNGAASVALSLIPFTSAGTMVMRMAVPAATIPAWQIALSVAVLAASVWLVLVASARIFRIGLLMYGKSPTLPEILRWARTR